MKTSLVASLFMLLAFTSFAHAQTDPSSPATTETTEESVEKENTTLEKIAEGLEKAKNKTQEVASKVNNELNSSRSRRAADDYLIGLNYSWFDMILPGKYGITLGSIQGAKTTWELEYLRGTLAIAVDDIGSMTDERISLIRRSFGERNSFNFFYGLDYFNFEASLNQDLLSSVDPSLRDRAKRVRIQSLGLNFGVSNRWTFHKFNKHFTVTVDWLNWSQPLYETYRQTGFLDYSTNQDDKDTVKTVVNIFSYLPRFNALKVQLGMSF